MRTAALLFVGVCALDAQGPSEAMRRLEACAKKYQDIGSYEASAMARREVDPDLVAQMRLRFAYVGPGRLPADLPIPMLPQLISADQFHLLDRAGKPVSLSGRRVAGPGPMFTFEQMAWRVSRAKIAGTEIVNSHRCVVLEVQYEGTRRNPGGDPVRYWIDASDNTVWKMQFSEADPFSKTGNVVRWAVVWDSWVENGPPPTWATEAAKGMRLSSQRTDIIGRAAPEITGRTLSGQPFQLSKLRPRVVVLDFWATWCGPCSEEMAILERLKNSLGQNVEIWSVAEDEPDAVRRWMAERKRTLPTVITARGSAVAAYDVHELPQVIVIDRQGVVTDHRVGLTREEDLRNAIRSALDRHK